MLSPGQRYRDHARECVRMATRADTVQARAHFLDLARTWIESAIAEAEQAEAETEREWMAVAPEALPVSAGWSSGFV